MEPLQARLSPGSSLFLSETHLDKAKAEKVRCDVFDHHESDGGGGCCCCGGMTLMFVTKSHKELY